mmetsp:Transcript_27523/g.77144  ORF Transcript_27523/g.77144 Transcript_27523/m.77144 type:complete len:207 (+) Transcript_27523:1138-1758(+)
MDRGQDQHLAFGAVAFAPGRIGIETADVFVVRAQAVLVVGVACRVFAVRSVRLAHAVVMPAADLVHECVQHRDVAIMSKMGIQLSLFLVKAFHAERVHHLHHASAELVRYHLEVQRSIGERGSLAALRASGSKGHACSRCWIQKGRPEDGMGFSVWKVALNEILQRCKPGAGETNHSLSIVDGEDGVQVAHRNQDGRTSVFLISRH